MLFPALVLQAQHMRRASRHAPATAGAARRVDEGQQHAAIVAQALGHLGHNAGMNASLLAIRDAVTTDAEGIAAIYNDAVLHTTAIWNEVQVDAANRVRWMTDRQALGYPVLVADDGHGQVLGYASFGDWRAFDGYRQTVEHSVYVHPNCRGQGIGRQLMQALIARARGLGKHVMVAAIEAGNTGSIALHLQLGFVQTGLMPEVGTKFGRWLDLAWLQLRLDEAPPR